MADPTNETKPSKQGKGLDAVVFATGFPVDVEMCPEVAAKGDDRFALS